MVEKEEKKGFVRDYIYNPRDFFSRKTVILSFVVETFFFRKLAHTLAQIVKPLLYVNGTMEISMLIPPYSVDRLWGSTSGKII